MGKRDNKNASSSSSSSSSIIEKLQMLRSFVGDNSGFSESDLSTCLRQSGFLVEVAAEKLMTGQFQPPTKRSKTTDANITPNTSVAPTRLTPQSTHTPSVATSAASTKRSSPSPTTTTVHETTPHSKHDNAAAATTSSSLSSSSLQRSTSTSLSSSSKKNTSVLVTPRSATPGSTAKFAPWKATAWLLCQRWVSDGTNLTRNGACRYQEDFAIADSVSDDATAILRFRATRLQGSFPKHLAFVLVPLLHANLIRLEASALMEETNLNIGAHLPFSLSVWIRNPPEFFAIFDQSRSNSASYSKQFFGKAAAAAYDNNAKSKTKMTLTEAAFSLLEWAQHGQPLEEIIENFGNDNNSSSNSDSEEEPEVLVDETTNADQIEEEMPEWAQDVVSRKNMDLDDDEMDTPKGLKVELRPYQRQALHWMTQREKQASDHWKHDQLQLLNELAQMSTKSGKSSNDTSPPSGSAPIFCDVGPVLVNSSLVNAPTVGNLTAANFENPNSDNAEMVVEKDDTHPLWERRYLCNSFQTKAISFFVQPFLRKATATAPPAPTPCRGGILADSMGLGKTVMLLALVQASKNKNKDKGTGGSKGHGTLVVTPLSLLLQWETEIERKTSMTHRVHYGDTRKQPASFDDVDIVLTTYGSLQAEYQKYRNSQSISTSKLLSKRWERVILDECHFIKNPSTLAAKACGSLDAERRWCVSGTIIQNSLEDVYSLMRFLRHEPWCEQGFWKAAVTTVAEMSIALDRVKRVLAPIMIRRTKESVDKKGNPILNLPDVDSKIVMVDFTAPERQFYEALYQKSFDVFNGFIQKGTASTSYFKIFSLLQRLRQTCSHVALTVKSHMDEDDWNSAFAKKEKGTAKHGKPKTENATQLDEDTIDQSFLDTLMIKFKSMQRATAANCDGTGSHEDKDTNLEYLTLMAQKLNTAAMSQTSELNEECPICLENIALEAAVVTPCLHVFCNKCLMDTLTFSGNKPKRSGHFTSMEGDCPSCSEPILVKKLLKLTQEDGKFVPEFFHSSSAKPRVNTAPECSTKAEDAGAHEALQTAVNGSSSSKLEAILHELETIWEIEAGSKILIFSQFLGFLDVMEREFSSRNIPFARLDGKLSLKERVAVIQEFGSESKKSQDKRGTVLLISMKAGGVGLNLVSASTVFIADPWWNGAVEQQCIDRIHRIGQQAKEVRVRRFCVANTIEERILELQERKKNIASAALRDSGNSAGDSSASRPSLDDFKLLFEEIKSDMKEKQSR